MASPYIVSTDALGRALAPNGLRHDDTETTASALSWRAARPASIGAA